MNDEYHEHENKPVKVTDKYHPLYDSGDSPVIRHSSHVRHGKKGFVLACCSILLILIAETITWYLLHATKENDETGSITKTQRITKEITAVKDYGNKYANGLLPVGDGKYKTDTPMRGYIYTCRAPTSEQGGAGSRGPWFTNNNTQWDMNRKPTVSGNVSWEQNLSITQNDAKRIITTNALPDHHTGTFPISASDPVHAYDANPSSISSQSLTYSLDANPTEQTTPSCIGGEVGIMTTGIPLFSGFDAGGRDAAAWEVQDSCDGHPQNKGEYHYHSLSRCITTQSYQTVIGYALDGFAITGPKVADNNIITTDDLDECHGMTGPIQLDGKTVTKYHYVMTQDFPYSVSCFKGQPVQPPGQPQSPVGQQGQMNQLPPKR